MKPPNFSKLLTKTSANNHRVYARKDSVSTIAPRINESSPRIPAIAISKCFASPISQWLAMWLGRTDSIEKLAGSHLQFQLRS